MHGFRVNAVPGGDICTLVISGEADIAAAPQITDLGTAALNEAAATTLIVDLAAVTFMDSTALGALIALHHAADRLGKQDLLDLVPERVQRLIDLSGLNGFFGTSTLADAPAAACESS